MMCAHSRSTACSVQRCWRTRWPPKSFSLEGSIEAGVLHFGAGERIELDAIFDATAAEHLQETPLTEDQKLSPAAKDRVRLQATVVDTPQLRWWLLAFGDGVEVKAPVALRAACESRLDNGCGLFVRLIDHYRWTRLRPVA